MGRVSTIIRGTTPLQVFRLPQDATEYAKVQISYIQDGRPLFTKTLDDMDVDEDSLSLQLSQAETFMFKGKMATAEMKLLTSEGDLLKAKQFIFHIGDTYDEEIMEADDE